jgi:hypothetical protein
MMGMWIAISGRCPETNNENEKKRKKRDKEANETNDKKEDWCNSNIDQNRNTCIILIFITKFQKKIINKIGRSNKRKLIKKIESATERKRESC